MKLEEVRAGMRVKVRDHHRIEKRRGLVGKVVGTYGGEEFTAVEVLFPDGHRRLFLPSDLNNDSSLRCQDDSFVATFSVRGATREGIVEAAQEDYRQLVQEIRQKRPDDASGTNDSR
jgi:hypothetical protein